MDVKNISIFLESLISVLSQYGVENIKKTSIIKKEVMNVNMDITALIGLTGEIKGNVAYSFGNMTGRKLISAKLGREVKNIDSIELKALEEIVNRITDKAGEMFSKDGKQFKITSPSLIIGQDMVFVISSVDTACVDIDTSYGKIQVNIGLES